MKYMFVIISIMFIIGCTPGKQNIQPKNLPENVQEAYGHLKKLEHDFYDLVDHAECLDKYPVDQIPNSQISGKIYDFRNTIEDAGYMIVWDCEKGGFTLTNKKEGAASNLGTIIA